MVVNCPRCWGVTNRLVRGMCPDCLKQEHEDVERCQAHLRQHKGLTVNQLSTETQIPVRRILGWIREGRIEIPRPEATGVVCERCGRPIASGKICAVCASDLGKSLKEALADVKKPSPEPEAPTEERWRHRRKRDDDEPRDRFSLRP